MKCLAYLELVQLVNSIKHSVRSPKTFIPLLIVGAWLIAWLIHGLIIASGAAGYGSPGFGQWGNALQRLPDNIDIVHAGVFLFLSIGCVIVIYQAFVAGMLVFPVAYIDFLFPTPISRGTVLLVKLVKDYLKYGFWTAFLFVFLGAPALGALDVKLFPDGFAGIGGLVALIILVVNLAHTINVVFTIGYERLEQAGAVTKGVLVGCLGSVLAYGLYQFIRTGDSYASVLSAANSPVISILFAPAKWCSTLILAPLLGTTGQDYAHLAMLWLLAAGSFALLMSRRENVYEPSLRASISYARRRQAVRTGDLSGLRMAEMLENGVSKPKGLSITPFGSGASAVFWKELIARYRVSRGRLLMVMAMPIAVVVLLRRFDQLLQPDVAGLLPLMLIYATWLLSLIAQPMRSELNHADILKAVPIAGWKMMLAYTAAGSALLTVVVLTFAGAMWAILPEARSEDLLACACAAPFLGFACVAANILASLFYPATGDAAQTYVCGMISFGLSMVALMPTLVLGLILDAILDVKWYYVVSVVGAVNVGVGAAGVALSGSVFRAFDPTND